MIKPILPTLRNWAMGNRFSSSHLQEPVDALRSLILNLASIGESDDARLFEEWPGKIVDSGPNGQSLVDIKAPKEQYWVQRQFIQGAQSDAPIVLQEDAINDGYDDVTITSDTFGGSDTQTLSPIFLVTNVPEQLQQSHGLPIGLDVWVIAVFDGGLTDPNNVSNDGSTTPPSIYGDNQKHYLMFINPGTVFPVLLDYATGDAGSNNPPAKATLVYNVSDTNGNVIGSSVGLWMDRQYGHVTPATRGMAAWIGGTLYIMDCVETIDVFNCPTS